MRNGVTTISSVWNPARLAITALVCLLLALPAGAADKNEVETVSAEGLRTRIETYKGRPLVLVYWASWCMPCRNYREKLAEVRELYPESDLAILGISVDTDKARLERYLAEYALPFPTVLASEELCGARGGLPVPTTVLFDAKSKETQTLTGNVDKRRLQYFVKKLF